MNGVWQKIFRIDRDNNQVTVINKKGQKYIVDVAPELKGYIEDRCIILGDLAKVVKSSVSGEWVMIDFKIDPEMYEDKYECPCNQVSLDVFDEPDYSFNTEEAEWI